MKLSLSTLLLASAVANAHTIFQKVSVNGADQGSLVGLRAPRTNNPIYSATDSNIACQVPGSTSSTVINVPAGARVGTWWGHVIGGAQYAGDRDNPIASSHKGPIQVYLARVSNAATASVSGLQWFKIASEGLSGSRWAVDTMISGNGWWYFDLPSCIAPGHYLARVELIALHSAYDPSGSQFYGSCIQINVTGGGSFTPSSTVSFPGAYSLNDPGILLNIYDQQGLPTNGGRSYTPPGPPVITCSGGGGGGGGGSTTRSSSSPTRTSSANGSGQTAWGQCGGTGWTGPTSCASGTCTYINAWYSQCIP